MPSSKSKGKKRRKPTGWFDTDLDMMDAVEMQRMLKKYGFPKLARAIKTLEEIRSL